MPPWRLMAWVISDKHVSDFSFWEMMEFRISWPASSFKVPESFMVFLRGGATTSHPHNFFVNISIITDRD